jgi:uncharacterized OsmC-like protein
MFTLTLTDGPFIDVQGRTHAYRYSTDGSAPNPLESCYAKLAGCAGVYAKKACRELGIDDAGIRIGLRIVARPGQALMPARIVTTVEFPGRLDAAQRAAVLASIGKCAVKAVMQQGASIEFLVQEDRPAHQGIGSVESMSGGSC